MTEPASTAASASESNASNAQGSAPTEQGWGKLLIALAAWNVFIWVTFARNLHAAYVEGEDRATGYWVAHSVLIVAGLASAVVLTWIGRLVLRPGSLPAS